MKFTMRGWMTFVFVICTLLGGLIAVCDFDNGVRTPYDLPHAAVMSVLNVVAIMIICNQQ